MVDNHRLKNYVADITKSAYIRRNQRLMSKVQNPLIGRAAQKMGGAVFTTWKGINVLKTKPLSVANPRSDAQTMRRSALTQVVHIYRAISAAIQAGYKEQAVLKSEYNAFASDTLNNAFTYSAPPAATLVPASVLVAKGTIASQAITSATVVASTKVVTANWSSGTLQPGQSTSDKAVIVLYNITTNTWQASVTSVSRSANTANFTASIAITAGNTTRVFLFFINSAAGKASDSVNSAATAS